MVAQYGLADVVLCTMMEGGILFALGALKLGSLIKFVPHPVTVGFTCGIAVTIFSTQIHALLGLQLENEPAQFLPKMGALAAVLPSISWPTVALPLVAGADLFFLPTPWGPVPRSHLAVWRGRPLPALFPPPSWR